LLLAVASRLEVHKTARLSKFSPGWPANATGQAAARGWGSLIST
jgi:hypothetical protein